MSQDNGEIFESAVRNYYSHIDSDPHHRFISWEHCYLRFSSSDFCKNDFEKDISALHLAFYLASWGMYRGSTDLLNKDYKILLPIIDVIKNHNELRQYNYLDSDQWISDHYVSKVLDVNSELSEVLKKVFNDGATPTDTLVSKILLGTLGCIPAYDRYVKQGMSAEEVTQAISEKGLKSLINFCKNKKDKIHALSNIMRLKDDNNLHYPPMKIIDMYFWITGLSKEKEVLNCEK
ncbi:hypothetical protein [Thiosulfativibrio zosterae]|uniref:Uncharacterized protein n=1 Tax=Thiosulfativibrio zosterae TaxID=2675053 RepID=A0A6F8PM20_9GAMM|nr:hypothetical protein [Thiosulfativibrio zosterae]BBP43118.1 hypothetical protein THMIRHAT_08640 [Thiosulfativibrio zosterae]